MNKAAKRSLGLDASSRLKEGGIDMSRRLSG